MIHKKSDRKVALLFCFVGLKMGLIFGIIVELSYFEIEKMEAKMELELEAFRCSFIILKKPILANRLFSLFAERLRFEVI